MSLLFDLLRACHYNSAVVWDVPLCMPREDLGPIVMCTEGLGPLSGVQRGTAYSYGQDFPCPSSLSFHYRVGPRHGLLQPPATLLPPLPPVAGLPRARHCRLPGWPALPKGMEARLPDADGLPSDLEAWVPGVDSLPDVLEARSTMRTASPVAWRCGPRFGGPISDTASFSLPAVWRRRRPPLRPGHAVLWWIAGRRPLLLHCR
jgi:hypothetical protein